MSSGGMDWAYRMIGQHRLDPLGVAVVLHLGWRDAANLRTDRGIASALGQHRSSVRLATAKLEAMGVICRRSGQWVAVETVKIVEQASDARRPDPASADDGGPVSGPGQSVARGGPVSGPLKGQSVAPMRKEKYEKGRAASGRVPPRRSPLDSGGGAASTGNNRAKAGGPVAAVADLTPFQRGSILRGASVLVDKRLVAPGTAEFSALSAALAASGAGL